MPRSFPRVVRLSVALAATAIALIALAPVGSEAHATTTSESRNISLSLLAPTVTPASTVALSELVQVLNDMAARSPVTLTAAVEMLVAASGASVGVTLIELGGPAPLVWSFNGSGVFTAASTYKLVALMMEAQNIAAGRTNANGLVCFEDTDYEAGWYDDYESGACFTRNELARRAGREDDVAVGIAEPLMGCLALRAGEHVLHERRPEVAAGECRHVTHPEASGSLGGQAAQSWLYPFLTSTKTESGIPAGVGGQSAVVHKTGTLDEVDNDAALVVSGPNGPYTLTVMTDGLGEDSAWQLIASISQTVWSFEGARAK